MTERAPRLTALAAGLAAIPVWIYLARDRTFAVDEWDFVEDRWRGGLDAVLERHNEHIIVIPALIYRVLFETVGIDQAWPYRLVVLAMQSPPSICGHSRLQLSLQPAQVLLEPLKTPQQLGI